ncbi:glycosyltransferase [Photobacterium sp. SDRW27]|uniref:glycosyltransferase family 2 protein n=1 Tax=Photobacterium obscurum TaxID=2829490 RepID=UPI00224357E2|nr:glycosyltransferase family 2 protein [Photobacterium obscurum]MCW8328253.1 glycosyltransferase [Photobacterium obscurum]
MKFSVVIAAYNASDTIARTLQSLQLQSYKNFEVLLVDDASRDASVTKEIADGFFADGLDVTFIQHETNKNGAAARNTGIEAATGEYIAFIDADDEWVPSKLEKYKDHINEYGGEYLLYSQVTVSNEGGETFTRPERGISETEHVSEYLFLTGGFIQTSAICVPSKVAKEIQFDTRFKRHQDYDFCLRVFSKGLPIKYIAEPLTIYHIEGAVYKSKLEDFTYCFWWLNEMKSFMSKHGEAAYQFYLISGRLYCAKLWPKLFVNVFTSVFKLGPRGLWKSRLKLKFILRNLLNG